MLSATLKRLRTRRKLTQSDIAKRLGVARTTYAMYEQGQREPDYATLIKIADFYDVTTDYLLGREEKPSIIEQSSLFSFENIGLSQKEYDALTAYQQEVLEWAASEEGPMFKNQNQNVLDMLEQLEIVYEVQKAMKKRKGE